MRRFITLSAALLAAIMAIATVSGPAVGLPASAKQAGAVAMSGPSSPPVWWPLRAPARSDCYKDNPGCHGYHGHWAMDIDGNYGNTEPVHPMGAGIVHIGSLDYRCGPTLQGRGAFVWIDHGNGTRSYYGHLIGIVVQEGQYVTPKTRLAFVGNSGYGNCLLRPNFRYLYVAVRQGEDYVQVTQLKACVNGAVTSWPQAFGYYNWNQIPQFALHLPAVHDDCIPDAETLDLPPAAPSPKRGRSGTLIYRLPDVSGKNPVLELQRYHPSVDLWSAERTVAVTRKTVRVGGLDNGWTYRARLSATDKNGYTRSSAWVKAVPAGKPKRPLFRLVHRFHTAVTLAWYRVKSPGAEIKNYQVAARRVFAHHRKGKWHYRTINQQLIHHMFKHMKRGKRYQVAVRATNELGHSYWLRRVVRTVR